MTPDWPLTAMAVALAVYAGTALIAVAVPRRALGFVYRACVLASVLACAADISAFASSADIKASLPLGLPSVGLRFHLDGLSAFFGLIVNLGILTASLYGIGLGKSDLSKRIEPFFPAFCAAMNVVLLADDAFCFLFFWELMSLSSWALVVARHEEEENRKAGYVYLVMAACGTTALLFAFGGMAGPAGAYAFDAIRQHSLSPAVSGLVLTAALIGTGSKAGLMPFHAWLPLAHPAAPSHVSALMSGVMTKVAVYAIIRIVFDLLGSPPWWWSLPFIILGAATAVGGLLYAVQDRDLKRVLAYSTIENIGIIFAGLGLAIAFKSTGIVTAAAVAMAAALNSLPQPFVVQVAAFPRCRGRSARDRQERPRRSRRPHSPHAAHRLLLADWRAGDLRAATAQRLRVGMAPVPGSSCRSGLSRAAAEVPLAGPGRHAGARRRAGSRLLRAGVRHGLSGRPRSQAAAEAHEVPSIQSIAMGFLAVLCVLGGLFGGFTAYAIGPLLKTFTGTDLAGLANGPTRLSLVAFDQARSIYDAPTIVLFVAISSISTMLFVHLVFNRRTRRAPAWDCGFPDASPTTQYTASSYSQPLRRVYKSIVLGADVSVDMPAPGD